MSAKIVTLPSVRKSGVRCEINGVVFPQLYRLTGYYFKLKEGRQLKGGMLEDDSDMEPDYDAATTPAYTLGLDLDYGRIAEPKWTPISRLDPAIDKGWIMIRHHDSPGQAETYIDAMYDTENFEFGNERFHALNTEFGVFTLLHRMPNEAAPDCLVVYKTKIPDPFTGGQMDWDKVVASDERKLTLDDLDPPHVQEGFAPLKNFLSEHGITD